MSGGTLFDQIISELQQRLENSDHFDQELTPQILDLFRQSQLDPEKLKQIIEAAVEKDSQ